MRNRVPAMVAMLAVLLTLIAQCGTATAAHASNGKAIASGAASSTWYLAEGSTAWGFSTYITIENPNNSRLHAHLTYMTRDGKADGGVVSLAPESETTIYPQEIVGRTDFSTKVECVEGGEIAADRTMTWSYPEQSPEYPDMEYPYYYWYQDGHSSIGVTSPSTTWYLPEGCSAYGFETWLLIQNPNA
ncbi:MAG TPA: hypothetical protein VIK22_15025, partial [Candidatus Anoxymicrobiaceae bacterium]